MQIRQTELHWRQVSGVQRGRSGGEARPQRQHFLRVRKLSDVQIHFGAQTARREMPELRQRIPGGKKSEGRTSDRMPEQRMRLRAAGAACRSCSNDGVESIE